jgi:hypothetical protein
MRLLIAFLGMLGACAHAPEMNGPPVYWTEKGTPPYEEMGRVSGTTGGYCLSGDGVYWAAVHDALAKARAMGADGIPIPNSMAAGATWRASDATACHWILQILGIPGNWGAQVDVVALKFRKNEPTAQPTTPTPTAPTASKPVVEEPTFGKP